MNEARLDALRAMARQDDSPRERDVARAKLQAAGEGWDEPPRRPPVADPEWPEPYWRDVSVSTANVRGYTVSLNIDLGG